MARKRKPPNGEPPPPVTADTPLTQEELLFVTEYMVDRKQGPAWMRMHPECLSMRTASGVGHEIRNRTNVAAEIRARMRAQAIRCQVNADTVIREIKRIAFADVLDLFDPNTNLLVEPRRIPLDLRRAIASVRVTRQRRTRTRNGRTTTTVTEAFVEYKFWNKLDALAKLANRLGLSTEIPPLEALLQMLPRTLAVQVRAALLAPPETAVVPAPSANGTR